MIFFRQAARVALCWAAAHPLRAAQLAVALGILGVTLAKTKRVDRDALKRMARVFL